MKLDRYAIGLYYLEQSAVLNVSKREKTVLRGISTIEATRTIIAHAVPVEN